MKTEKGKSRIKEVLPLTPMQQCMMFNEVYEKEKGAYIQQLSFKINGDLSVSVLKEAFGVLISNTDIFRSRFVYQNLNEMKMVIFNDDTADFRFFDYSQIEQIDFNELYDNAIRDDIKEGFDLQNSQLIRLKLYYYGGNEYLAILTFHHIIIDGWSMPIVISELFDYYKALKKNEPIPSKDNRFSDYTKYISNMNQKVGLLYWQKYLEGYNTEIFYPSQKRSYLKGVYRLEKVALDFTEEETNEIKKIASLSGSTVPTFVNVVWGIILAVYSQSNDIVFGRVVSGRNVDVRGIENKIGIMVNTIPLRVKYDNDERVQDIIKRVQSDIFYQYKYEYLSLFDIQEKSEMKNSLISNIITFENYPLDNLNGLLSDVDFEVQEIQGYEHTSYDINITASLDECLHILISYNREKHHIKSIQRMCKHIYNIVKQIIYNPEIKVSDIVVSTKEELNLIKSFNDNDITYNNVDFIYQYLEKNAELYPDNIALYYDEQKISYREMNNRTNQLAHFLREKGVKPNNIIVVSMRRSVNMMIAIFGIMKAGAAYLPIAFDAPSERKKLIIEQSSIKFIFDDVFFDNLDLTEYSTDNLVCVNSSDDLAYIIYTSGSTGVPKGTMNHHKGFLNRVEWMRNEYNIQSDDILIQKTINTFDVSMWELFLWSFTGASLVLFESGCESDPERITECLYKYGVTVVHFVPSMLRAFMSYLKDSDIKLPKLKTIFTSGEELLSSDLRKLKKLSDKISPIHMANLYGPAECSIDVTYYNADLDYIPSVVPIGKTVSNSKVYILDESLNPLPIGVIGEIYIGGIAVGKGYLNNPQETERVFIKREDGSVIYKTGDRGRFLTDGNIEYFGRNDFMIKIRGIRIEVNEIENQLTRINGIINSCIILKKDLDGDKMLVCFIERKDETVDAEYVRKSLSKVLPLYMLPSIYIFLDKMPLNSSNKIDRKKLQGIDTNGLISYHNENSDNMTSIQKQLIEIWADVLKLSSSAISINSNFFHIGGHSIKAFMLANQIEKKLGFNIDMKSIFNNPTIKLMSEFIEKKQENSVNTIPVSPVKEYYELSPIQKGIYYTSIHKEYDKSYNMPALYKINGNIDIDNLNASLMEIMKCHDILKTVFVEVDGEIKSKIIEDMTVQVSVINSEDETEDQLMEHLVRKFDISQGPLFRIELIYNNKQMYLFFDMHHIISDGYSCGILMRDLILAYKGRSLKRSRIQYKDYAEYTNKNQTLMSEYWKKQLDRYLNTSFVNIGTESVNEHCGKSVYDFYDESTLYHLKNIAGEYSVTLFALMFSIYSISLSRFLNTKDVIIGTGNASRQMNSVSDLIGPFVSSSFIINEVETEQTFSLFCGEQANQVLDMISHSECSINDMLNYVSKTTGRHIEALFDNLFVFQNMEFPELHFDSFNLRLCDTKYGNAMLKFAIYVYETADGLKLNLTYDSAYISDDRINEFMSIMRKVTINLLENNDGTIGELLSENIKQFHDVEFDFNF